MMACDPIWQQGQATSEGKIRMEDSRDATRAVSPARMAVLAASPPASSHSASVVYSSNVSVSEIGANRPPVEQPARVPGGDLAGGNIKRRGCESYIPNAMWCPIPKGWSGGEEEVADGSEAEIFEEITRADGKMLAPDTVLRCTVQTGCMGIWNDAVNTTHACVCVCVWLQLWGVEITLQ